MQRLSLIFKLDHGEYFKVCSYTHTQFFADIVNALNLTIVTKFYFKIKLKLVHS